MQDLQQYKGKYVVYLLTSPSGKHYCGYSSNLSRRWRGPEEYCACHGIYRAIQKYGWDNIKKQVLYVFDNASEALAKEKEIIEKYDLINKGYNLVEGGGTPPHGLQFVTKEGYKAMQANGKRLANEMWNDPQNRQHMIQRMREEDHKARMNMTLEQRKQSFGAHNKGRTPVNAKAILQIDKNTNEIIAEFTSAGQAALAITGDKVNGANIQRTARGKGKTAYGYKWQWKN